MVVDWSGSQDISKHTERPAILLVGYFVSWMTNRRSPTEDLADYLRSVGINTLTIRSNRNRCLRLIQLLVFIWRKRPDYVLASVDIYSNIAFLWGLSACALLRALHCQYVLVLHGGLLPQFARSYPRTMQRLLCSARAVVAPSEYLRSGLATYCKHITIVPFPLNTQLYPYRERSILQPTLLWLRAFDTIYNPRLAIQVAAALFSTHSGVRLTMIGPESERGLIDDLRTLASMLGIGNAVHIVPGVPHSEVGQWLDHADIFLNTSNIDNFPMTLLQAMAGGLCIVTTNPGGVSSLVESEVDCLLTPCNETALMTQAVQRLLKDPELAQRLSKNARMKAQRFDWSQIGPLWEDILSVQDRATRKWQPEPKSTLTRSADA